MLRDGRDCCDQGRGDPTRDRCGCHKWTEASDWRPQILLRKMARSCAPRRTRAGNGNIKSGSQSRQYMQAPGISGEGPWEKAELRWVGRVGERSRPAVEGQR